MYEEAFEMSEKTFDDKMRNNNSSKLQKNKEEIKMPSLLKGDSASRVKSSKLKPLDDKLSQSKLAEKQHYIDQHLQGNVYFILSRWNGSTTSPEKSNSEQKNQLAVQNVSRTP